MKFTAKEVKNTPYKYIDIEEHFKDIRNYPEDDECSLDYYKFELLLEDKTSILFAIINNYRAEIYNLNLETFHCDKLGTIGTTNLPLGDSLYLRAIDREKIAFEYRLNDNYNINGVYSTVDRDIVFKFKTSSEYDYLYLTDRYYIVSKDSFVWDESKDGWVYDFQQDRVYLYDRVQDARYEIYDKKIKSSYHTPSNHFVNSWDGIDYLLNFPFNMDPEDSEALLKRVNRNQVLNTPKEISFIVLDKFVKDIKMRQDIKFKTFYSWNSESVIQAYFYATYTLKSLVFSVYDLKNKTIQVFKPTIENGNPKVESIVKGDYSNLETCRNIFYIGAKTILANRDDKTIVLSPIEKTIEHTNREVVVDVYSNGYMICGWDEEEDGSNYRDYTRFVDDDCNEIALFDDYYLDLKLSKILMRI